MTWFIRLSFYNIGLTSHEKVTIKDKQALEATKKKPQAKVTEERSATTEKPAQKSHTVVSGDTLWGIAQTFYGDGSRYTEIYEANKDKIKTLIGFILDRSL